MKTLRNWIVELDDRNARLVLLAVANSGSAAAKLHAGEERDVAAALQALERTARESTSAANADDSAAFLALDPSAQVRADDLSW